MMRKLPLFLSGVALGAIALVAADEVRMSMSANAAANDTYRRLTLFGEVFDKIRSDYVDKP
ncbi:MAG: S41 family peptidase, partial [Rhabdaerophilum sp.]